jgi:hypothetical protein
MNMEFNTGAVDSIWLAGYNSAVDHMNEGIEGYFSIISQEVSESKELTDALKTILLSVFTVQLQQLQELKRVLKKEENE